MSGDGEHAELMEAIESLRRAAESDRLELVRWQQTIDSRMSRVEVQAAFVREVASGARGVAAIGRFLISLARVLLAMLLVSALLIGAARLLMTGVSPAEMLKEMLGTREARRDMVVPGDYRDQRRPDDDGR